MAAPVIDWNVVHSFGVDQLTDMLSTNHRFLVEAVVRNNPQAVADAVGITDRIAPDRLAGLVLAMDEDEQAEALDVEYLTGKNADMDEAFGIMFEQAKAAGTLGEMPDGGPSRFVMLAATGLAAVASAFLGSKNAKQQAEAEARTAQAQLEQQLQAEQQAQGRALARVQALKKAAPWLAAALLCIILAILKLR